jgi:putative hydrolase of the HAD superfamily
MQKSPEGIRAIIFDLGYTLINFSGDLPEVSKLSYSTLTDQLIANGCRLDHDAFTARFHELMHLYYTQREIDLLELPVHRIVNRALEEFGQSCVDETQIISAMHRMYEVTEGHWQLEDDTLETLTRLQEEGYSLGMVTNASDAWDVNNLIDNNHLREFFNVILISAEEGIRKPDRRIFEKAARLLEVDLTQMVMVGDTLQADILGARQCGMKAVWISRRAEGVRYQLRVKPELQADAEIQTLAELPDLIASWNN